MQQPTQQGRIYKIKFTLPETSGLSEVKSVRIECRDRLNYNITLFPVSAPSFQGGLGRKKQ
jgi:hypothetical protein